MTALRTITLGLLVGLGATVYAQQTTGVISGKVTDGTGAVIPNAAITITDKATNTARNEVTNSAGLYSAPSLPNGEYEVRVALQGFQTAVRDATVEAGKTTAADFTLMMGGGTEVLRLEAVAPLVNRCNGPRFFPA